jgi:hypothetical protein
VIRHRYILNKWVGWVIVTIFALAAGFFLTGCPIEGLDTPAAPVRLSSPAVIGGGMAITGGVEVGNGNLVVRLVDEATGVVCYVVDGLRTESISCLALSSEALLP